MFTEGWGNAATDVDTGSWAVDEPSLSATATLTKKPQQMGPRRSFEFWVKAISEGWLEQDEAFKRDAPLLASLSTHYAEVASRPLFWDTASEALRARQRASDTYALVLTCLSNFETRNQNLSGWRDLKLQSIYRGYKPTVISELQAEGFSVVREEFDELDDFVVDLIRSEDRVTVAIDVESVQILSSLGGEINEKSFAKPWTAVVEAHEHIKSILKPTKVSDSKMDTAQR